MRLTPSSSAGPVRLYLEPETAAEAYQLDALYKVLGKRGVDVHRQAGALDNDPLLVIAELGKVEGR